MPEDPANAQLSGIFGQVMSTSYLGTSALRGGVVAVPCRPVEVAAAPPMTTPNNAKLTQLFCFIGFMAVIAVSLLLASPCNRVITWTQRKYARSYPRRP